MGPVNIKRRENVEKLKKINILFGLLLLLLRKLSIMNEMEYG